MSTPRVNAGDISTSLTVIRGGKTLKSGNGESNLVEFLRAWEIYESIEQGLSLIHI